jgi:HAD superfamily hydrolase (TIGR01509 family)
MIKAIVFDLGGTLIDYAAVIDEWPGLEEPGLNAAYGYLKQQGLSLPAANRFRETGYALLPERWEEALRGVRNLTVAGLLGHILSELDCELPPASVLDAAARRYEAALCAYARPIPGGYQLLANLKDQGYSLGLISNTMFTGQAHLADLARFNLDSFFDAWLFSADVNKWKPDPAPFQHLLADLAVAPENAVFVGDDPAADVVGGRAAGMRTIFFPSSQRFAPPKEILPDAIIGSLADLPGVLAGWC